MRKRISISLSESEEKMIKQNANYLGMKPTTYVKALTLKEPLYIPKLNHEQAKKIYHELHRIGINLNQLTQKMNQSLFIEQSDKESLQIIQKEIQKLWEQL